MSYKLLKYGIQRISDKTWIPPENDNSDWQQYQKWLAEGNIPEPQDPEPPPSQDQIDAEAAKQYAKLIALKSMTPAQVTIWVDNNINTLADAKDALKTLAIALCVLARRL